MLLGLTQTAEPQYYKIDLVSNLLFKDKDILATCTRYIWKYMVMEQVTYYDWLVSLEVMETQQPDLGAIQKTADFLRLTNKPLEKLVLLLDGNGIIKEVQNKSEIWEKWNALKTEYVASKEEISSVEEAVIEKCRDDFRQLKNVLNSSLLHFSFFAPVYNVHPDNTLKRNLTFSSVVNSGSMLYNTVKQKITEDSDNKNWLLKHYCQHNDYGSINLQKRYNKEFKKILNAPFDYQFRYDGTSVYSPKTGLLQSAKATITEQASSEFIYTCEVNILLLEKGEIL